MPLSNTATAYGGIARLFHWLIALGIALMIPLGWAAHLWPMQDAAAITTKTTLFSAHKTLGVAIFFIALARIGFALSQPRPVPLHPERRAETLLAEAVHWALYSALVLVPLSGWIEHAATDGFAPIWWPLGQDLPLVPNSPALAGSFAEVHFLAQWLLVAALALHIAGALKHAVIDRDATLARMAKGIRAGTPHPHKGHATPALLASAAWLALLSGGAAAGLYGTAPTAETPKLEAAVSDWQVQAGSLSISVMQMGTEITGSFADWTAAIAWAEAAAPGPEGHVTVQIAIPSLALGSVTKQALGPDFFAATEHPTATFQADLIRTDDGREAKGMLALKGASIPLTLPFDLTVEGDTATMTGHAMLDRRDFAIGDGMSDPSQLGYEVQLRVTLTATRSEN
ncbi:cytochrome b/b6 domain-containing protein [Salipiger sp. 1_MG-2023]|uniref:cytochrome b/b6 domain-containing protein n=1 Tax=Salipiger sp. 1_MG-2023 TaxID=3062665 RepID=UPI0026E16541|nr:cytochrome b/b6 domain-containing protein [Salipiger sp. 1_MG-2023]MDO6585843.1 cytochrome b/b6 domain-containing protein [Salipiger sp. 1_MG-2023]